MTTQATIADPRTDEQAATLDPPPSAWLPLTAGDVARVRDTDAPEHGGPGQWFIFLGRLVAIGCAIGAVGSTVALVVALLAGEFQKAGWAALMVAGLALGSLVQSTLARHVEHFSRLGWWGAMAELSLATLSKVNVMVTKPDAFVGPLIGIVIDLLWMGYFWNRRADFGIDLDI
jgi:hypothetical protein